MSTFNRMSLIIFAISFIVACNPNITKTEPTPSPKIPTRTITLTELPTLIPKPTYIPNPTLNFDVQDKFYDLLKSNGDCELPCFLGIAPGKTLWADGESLLETFSVHKPITADKVASTKDFTIYNVQTQTNKDVSLLTTIQLEVNPQGVIQHIIFEAVLGGDPASARYDQHLSKYSLKEIFKTYGPPDMVYMSYIEKGLYSIHIFYEKLKLMVEITGEATKNEDGTYKVCPNLGEGEVASIKIAMAAPSDPIDISKYSLINFQGDQYESPINNAAGLSIDTFYNLMTQSNPACFQVK